ncbi:lysophosphatidylcholine acyltransferase 2-like isoform X2 [Babylonia areolata]|uniref:lysophosphatidylcholine acyltransferase 2-like isoform X2 n=1 Tax=Babylonia areolata TaxID=304850 RepID=UPI003FD3A240
MDGDTTARKRPIEFPRMHSVDQPRVQNPFVHRLQFSTLDIIKIVVMSITLAPLRLLLAILIILMVWPLAAIGNFCTCAEDKEKPLRGWKRGYSKVLRFFLRAVFFVCGFHWVKVQGKSTTSKEAPIVVAAPHSSMFDALAVLLTCELGSGVSRDSNAKIPIIGHIIQYARPVFVRREDPNSRHNTIREIQRRSQSGGEWPQIYIFPEGTCSNRTCLITFKAGAFIPGVAVQPLCIRYPNRLDTMTWTWDGPGAWKLLWLTLCQLHNHMEVEYLPVYHPSKEERTNPKLFANNVRRVMAECLELPVTDHTYDDCRLMMRAGSLNLPLEAGLVEFQKLHNKLGFSFDQMKELLQKFQTIDRSGSGSVTLTEFAEYLHLPVSPALEEVFTLYDRDQSGTINFREYIIGLSLIANPANSEDTLRQAFQLFDKDNKGYITQEELEIILCNAFTMDADEADELFSQADTDKDGKITYKDFRTYAEEKPEYASLFVKYHEMATSLASSSSADQNIIHVSPAKRISRRRLSKDNDDDDDVDKAVDHGTAASVDGKVKR